MKNLRSAISSAGFVGLIFLILLMPFSTVESGPATFDLVILNGRVIDPESRSDAIRNLGIAGGAIKAITTKNLTGRNTIDARGLVVSPGFIDLHQHGQNEENYRFKAMDGVTTALELEVGAGDIDAWYAEREQKALINYGVSVGHLAARMAAMHEPVTFASNPSISGIWQSTPGRRECAPVLLKLPFHSQPLQRDFPT